MAVEGGVGGGVGHLYCGVGFAGSSRRGDRRKMRGRLSQPTMGGSIPHDEGVRNPALGQKIRDDKSR